MDYQKLCIELFGTDNEAELRKLSEKLKKNARGAGRQAKFTETDAEAMREMLKNGSSPAETAAHFGTTVQTLGRLINKPIHEGCTMRMFFMHRNKICSIIDVDFQNERVYVENRTDDIFHRAFGAKESPVWDDLEYFLADRCFEQNRADLRRILKTLGLDSFDRLSILEKTAGRTAEDNMWIRFQYAENKA